MLPTIINPLSVILAAQERQNRCMCNLNRYFMVAGWSIYKTQMITPYLKKK